MINVKTLRTLRTDRGYSIRALATAAGVDHQTIRRLELGSDPDVPLRVLDRIAEALGVPAATLLDDSPDVEHRPLEQEIGGQHKTMVAGDVSHVAGGKHESASNGPMDLASASQMLLHVGGAGIKIVGSAIEISAGGSVIKIDGGGVSINGSKISLNG